MRRILLSSLIIALLGVFAASCGPSSPTAAPEVPSAIPSETAPPASPTNTLPPAATPTSPSVTDTTVSPTSGSASATDGQAVLESACTACHSLDRVVNKKASADEWTATVNRMVGKGASLTADEQAILIQYLAEKYK